MKFPYDYIALTAVPAFCIGVLIDVLEKRQTLGRPKEGGAE